MNLFSASAFGFIGGEIHPRGSAMTAIPIGESGDYNWAGITHVAIPTKSASGVGSQGWVFTTSTHTGHRWYWDWKSYPKNTAVTIPITGTGMYTAAVPWAEYCYNSSETAQEDNQDYGTPLNGSSHAYTDRCVINNSTTLYVNISNTGIQTAWTAWSGGGRTSHNDYSAFTLNMSAGEGRYQPHTTNLRYIIWTGTTASAIPSGTGYATSHAGPPYDNDIIGSVGSSVVALGSGIELYGEWP